MHRTRRCYSVAKRTFDIATSAAALLLLSPLLGAVGAWVKVQDGGPVLYRGTRVGYKGRQFQILKFRTMVVNAERIGPITTSDDDPRILRGGLFLRKWKLDELPQFINVLMGDMSIIGPRPEMQRAVDTYSPELLELLEVRPGIVDYGTLWNRDQGERLKGSSDPYADYMHRIFPVKTRLSLAYVRRRSLTLDVKIMLAAFGAVFMGIDPDWCLPEDVLTKAIAETTCASYS